MVLPGMNLCRKARELALLEQAPHLSGVCGNVNRAAACCETNGTRQGAIVCAQGATCHDTVCKSKSFTRNVAIKDILAMADCPHRDSYTPAISVLAAPWLQRCCVRCSRHRKKSAALSISDAQPGVHSRRLPWQYCSACM